MTLLQLQYFIAVCKHQSFTKAAQELSISQPGISVAMKELEAECGFPLFERRPNSIALTGQGRSFLREAEHMMGAYMQLQRNAKLIAGGKTVLRIGMATMGAGLVFPKLRKGFYSAHPEIRFEVVEDSTESLYQKVEAGELDFAFCVSIALPDEDCYRYVMVGKSRLLFCVHREDPLANLPVSSLADLQHTSFIMLSDRYSQTKYLKRLFQEVGYTPDVLQYTSQVFTVLQHIRENAAAGFLSEDIAQHERDIVSFALREVVPASITVIWKKDMKTFPAMDAFIQYIRNNKNMC